MRIPNKIDSNGKPIEGLNALGSPFIRKMKKFIEQNPYTKVHEIVDYTGQETRVLQGGRCYLATGGETIDYGISLANQVITYLDETGSEQTITANASGVITLTAGYHGMAWIKSGELYTNIWLRDEKSGTTSYDCLGGKHGVMSTNTIHTQDPRFTSYQDENGYSESVLSPEKLTNNEFETDTDWNKTGGWTITGGKAVANALSSGSQIYQTNISENGKTYMVKYTVSGYIDGGVRVEVGGAAGITRASNGTYQEEITSISGTIVTFRVLGASTTLNLDVVSCKEKLEGKIPLAYDQYGKPTSLDIFGGQPTYLGRVRLNTEIGNSPVMYFNGTTTLIRLTSSDFANIISVTARIKPDGDVNWQTTSSYTGLYRVNGNDLEIGYDGTNYFNGLIDSGIEILTTNKRYKLVSDGAGGWVTDVVERSYGEDLLPTYDFTDGWLANSVNGNIDSAHQFTATGNYGVYISDLLILNQKYKCHIKGSMSSADVNNKLYLTNNASSQGYRPEGSIISTTFDETFEFTPTLKTSFMVYRLGSVESIVTIDELAFEPVYEPINGEIIGANLDPTSPTGFHQRSSEGTPHALLNGFSQGLYCRTSGTAYRESTKAYGLVADVLLTNNQAGNEAVFIPITNNNVSYNSGLYQGYSLRLSSTKRIILERWDNSTTPASILFSAIDYIEYLKRYRILLFRNSEADEYVVGAKGTFALYAQGRAGYPITPDKFTVPDLSKMELVSVVGGGGSNPVSDNTYTTSNYQVPDLDAGDYIYELKTNEGIVDMREFVNDTGTYDYIEKVGVEDSNGNPLGKSVFGTDIELDTVQYSSNKFRIPCTDKLFKYHPYLFETDGTSKWLTIDEIKALLNNKAYMGIARNIALFDETLIEPKLTQIRSFVNN